MSNLFFFLLLVTPALIVPKLPFISFHFTDKYLTCHLGLRDSLLSLYHDFEFHKEIAATMYGQLETFLNANEATDISMSV